MRCILILIFVSLFIHAQAQEPETKELAFYKKEGKFGNLETLKLLSDSTYIWYMSGDLGYVTMSGTWLKKKNTLSLKDDKNPNDNIDFLIKKNKLFFVGKNYWMKRIR